MAVMTHQWYGQAGLSSARVAPIIATVLSLALATTATAETVTYFVPDHLGSPIAAMQSDGTLLWRESYDPYGNKRGAPSSADNDTGYTGHQSDTVTGFTYMQARYYDPVVGRFMGMDPIGFFQSAPMSFSKYTYAFNNPFSYIDPTGLVPIGSLTGTFKENDNRAISQPDQPIDSAADGRSETGTPANGDIVVAQTSPPGGTFDAQIKSAIARGDVEKLKSMLEALGPVERKFAESAIKRLETRAGDLIRGTLKRSKSYRSELEDLTLGQLRQMRNGPNKKSVREMLKLIDDEARLMQKNLG